LNSTPDTHMSWNEYVERLTAAGLKDAGIYDLEGNPWAYSPNFAAQIEEVKAVSVAIEKRTVADELGPKGAYVAGVKYMFVKFDDDHTVYVKLDNCGVVFARCNTCILVARHEDNIQGGHALVAVGKLRDYLAENNI